MRGTRDQAARDAVTVEIVFAVVTGALLAAVLFVAVASPALFGDLDRGQEATWVRAGALAATAGFGFRVVRVLRRFTGARSV
ncbi:DUF6332 family protein [Streptomyces palmae]|uniref:Uncharacterized protein n=1 Tax=Streptomyces palmae TaxID=1701085 RepID=A0A4Z0HAP4_9ACTN|nr:DUF6332 family protein [Streptomyces palmae]TGB11831.1 hypothetical protein E4099_11655 [Streptomyces palmae]